ncbi:MAG TPA: hypothetical protein VGR81_08890 [Candidatus Acidoferrales bacterium]|nr:hypothetical protein [Candidatus Acidoferrales bacterium]
MKLSIAVVATSTLTTGRAEVLGAPGAVGLEDMNERNVENDYTSSGAKNKDGCER